MTDDRTVSPKGEKPPAPLLDRLRAAIGRHAGFTPGPLEVGGDPACDDGIHGPHEVVKVGHPAGAKVRVLAQCNHHFPAEAEANARLFADSPVLLALLAEAAGELERMTAERDKLAACVREAIDRELALTDPDDPESGYAADEIMLARWRRALGGQDAP